MRTNTRSCGLVLLVTLVASGLTACGSDSSEPASPTAPTPARRARVETPAQLQTWNLTGTVRDDVTGDPLAGAMVTVSGGTSLGRMAMTTSQGTYLLAEVQEGGLTLRAAASGYGTVEMGVTLASNRAVDVQLRRTVTTGVGGGRGNGPASPAPASGPRGGGVGNTPPPASAARPTPVGR